jgi:hypothetical protein
MEKHILLERLKIRKPPTGFQDVCLNFFLQLGLRYNWRISMLKVLHAGNLLCAGVFIMRAELVFVSFFSGLAHLEFGCVMLCPKWCFAPKSSHKTSEPAILVGNVMNPLVFGVPYFGQVNHILRPFESF